MNKEQLLSSCLEWDGDHEGDFVPKHICREETQVLWCRSAWVCEVTDCSALVLGGQMGWHRMQAMWSLLSTSRDCGVTLGPSAISWPSEKGDMRPNPQRRAKKLMGRSRCAGLDLTRVVCKKLKGNGEERRRWDRKEHGNRHVGRLKSVTCDLSPGKEWFLGPESEGWRGSVETSAGTVSQSSGVDLSKSLRGDSQLPPSKPGGNCYREPIGPQFWVLVSLGLSPAQWSLYKSSHPTWLQPPGYAVKAWNQKMDSKLCKKPHLLLNTVRISSAPLPQLDHHPAPSEVRVCLFYDGERQGVFPRW